MEGIFLACDEAELAHSGLGRWANELMDYLAAKNWPELEEGMKLEDLREQIVRLQWKIGNKLKESKK